MKINLSVFKCFNDNKDTLKNTSYDSENNVHMTENEKEVVNFDSAIGAYIKNINKTFTPKSVDAFFTSLSGDIIFVEFKNGKIPRDKLKKEAFQNALRIKITESILCFNDITGATLTDLRKDGIFILVYNKLKTPTSIQNAQSFKKFTQKTAVLAQTKPDPFNLNKFKNFYFREAHAFTINEFENYLKNIDDTA